MGNSVSFCFIHHSNSKKEARIIDSKGDLREIKLPAKAAEIMLEETGNVVCAVDQVMVLRRAVAMKADDEILAGKVYVSVPVGRVNCRVTNGEMERLEFACGKKKAKVLTRRRRRNGGKVSPAGSHVMESEEMREEQESRVGVLGAEIPGLLKGNYKATAWSPTLEPISEK